MTIEIIEKLGQDVKVRYLCCGREDVMRAESARRHEHNDVKECKYCAQNNKSNKDDVKQSEKQSEKRGRKAQLIVVGAQVAGFRILKIDGRRVLVQCLNCGAKAWVTKPNIYGRLRAKTSTCRACTYQ